MKIFLPVLFIFFSPVVYAQTPFSRTVEPTKYEGDKPYTPTRIEWLASEYRNECGLWLGGIPTVSWSLNNKVRQKDTITVTVRFTDEKIRTDAQQAAETCERNMRALARDRGWNWLKVELDVGNVFVSKNPKGYTLTTPFAELNLQAGDVIKTVNYFPVSSLADAQKIAALLKDKKTVRVEYQRAGDTKVTTFEQ